ncbi:hypothetical protein ACFQZC_21015 [Streptacidiphilus monticola]
MPDDHEDDRSGDHTGTTGTTCSPRRSGGASTTSTPTATGN